MRSAGALLTAVAACGDPVFQLLGIAALFVVLQLRLPG